MFISLRQITGDMKTTVKQQRSILSMIKKEVDNNTGVKSIAALVRGYGNPDNVVIDGNKISIRVSHKNTYLYAKDGY